MNDLHTMMILLLFSFFCISWGHVPVSQVTWNQDLDIGPSDLAKGSSFVTFMDALRIKPYLYGAYAKDHRKNIALEDVGITTRSIKISDTVVAVCKEDTWTLDSDNVQGIRFRLDRNHVIIHDLLRVKVEDGRLVLWLMDYPKYLKVKVEKLGKPRIFHIRKTKDGRMGQGYLLKDNDAIIFRPAIHISSIAEGMMWYTTNMDVTLSKTELRLFGELVETTKAFLEAKNAVLDANIEGSDTVDINDVQVNRADLRILKSLFLHFPIQSDREYDVDLTSKRLLNTIIDKAKKLKKAVRDLAIQLLNENERDNEYIIAIYCMNIYNLINEWRHFDLYDLNIEVPISRHEGQIKDGKFRLATHYNPELVEGDSEFSFSQYDSRELVGDDFRFVLDEQEFSKLVKTIPTKKYRVVSIVGEQSTGKSTLLNFLFNTFFKSKISTRLAETIGISISRSTFRSIDDNSLIVIDCEGLFGMDKKEEIGLEGRIEAHHDKIETTRMKYAFLCLLLTDLFIFRMKFSDIKTAEEKYTRLQRILDAFARNPLVDEEEIKRRHILFIFQDVEQQEHIIREEFAYFANKLSSMIKDIQHHFKFSVFFLVNPNYFMGTYMRQVHELSAMIHYDTYSHIAVENTGAKIAHDIDDVFFPKDPVNDCNAVQLFGNIKDTVETIQGSRELIRDITVVMQCTGTVIVKFGQEEFKNDIKLVEEELPQVPFDKYIGEYKGYARKCKNRLNSIIKKKKKKFKKEIGKCEYNIVTDEEPMEDNEKSVYEFYKELVKELIEKMMDALMNRLKAICHEILVQIFGSKIIPKQVFVLVRRSLYITKSFSKIIKDLETEYKITSISFKERLDRELGDIKLQFIAVWDKALPKLLEFAKIWLTNLPEEFTFDDLHRLREFTETKMKNEFHLSNVDVISAEYSHRIENLFERILVEEFLEYFFYTLIDKIKRLDQNINLSRAAEKANTVLHALLKKDISNITMKYLKFNFRIIWDSLKFIIYYNAISMILILISFLSTFNYMLLLPGIIQIMLGVFLGMHSVISNLPGIIEHFFPPGSGPVSWISSPIREFALIIAESTSVYRYILSGMKWAAWIVSIIILFATLRSLYDSIMFQIVLKIVAIVSSYTYSLLSFRSNRIETSVLLS